MNNVMEELGLLSAERSAAYEPKVVTATVTSASPDVATLRLLDGSTGIMPVTEFYPSRRWEVGATYQLLRCDDNARPLLSATRRELLTALLMGVSPEVRAGSVRVMGVARAPGVRAKLAVAATEPGIDPIACCVGRDANRVRYLSRVLMGERVDVISWHPDPEIYLRNALAPAGVLGVTISDGRASAVAPQHQMSAAVGGGGLNSSLAGQLLGLQVRIVAEGDQA